MVKINRVEDFMREEQNAIALGASIARLRKKQGLSQTELAKRLYISNKTVSKWERGVSQT